MDAQKLRPAELCGLLNSTPLGTVLTATRLKRHRELAGMRIGDGRHVDLIRYVAWLVLQHQAPKQKPGAAATPASTDLTEAVESAVEQACCHNQIKGHGEKFTRKHKEAIAALICEPTHAQAAAKIGISKSTLTRWLRIPEFQAARQQAQRALYDAAVGRMQAMSGQLLDSLSEVALHGKRDSDRVRASLGLLDRAHRGLPRADVVRCVPEACAVPHGTAGLVKVLEMRLQEVNQSDLPLDEKTRLTSMLTPPLLRALNEDELAKRLEAVEAVLRSRATS